MRRLTGLLGGAISACLTLSGADVHVSAVASRGAACSALLPGGRSLVTGGRAGQAPLAAAAYFERGGLSTPVANMSEPRSGHLCVALKDGRVLVGGGETASGGPTNSAEVFRPDTNIWSPAAPMRAPRTGAAAVLLSDGRVLIAGGEVDGRPSSTLEIFDPEGDRFEQVYGTLTAPRTRHAIAVLDDGRVVIAGGKDGEQLLDSIEIYDPAKGLVSLAGRMTVPRADLTATPLPGNRVLLAGGAGVQGALDSAEIFDAGAGACTLAGPMSVPRQGHLAVRINPDGGVLLTALAADGGGFGPAEVFDPGTATFRPLEEAAPGEAARELTVGIVGPESSVRRHRTYRVPQRSARATGQ